MNGQKYESGALGQLDAYLDDPKWVAEQKLDGVRVMAHVGDGRQVQFQGPGGAKINFSAAAQWFPMLSLELAAVPAGTVLDGELILETGIYWLFDMPYMPRLCQPEQPLVFRRDVLERAVALVRAPHIRVVPQARTSAEKRRLWESVKANGAEGIVVKRNLASYAIGRRTSDVLKFKHTKTIDVVITARDTGGKNAELSLVRDKRLVRVGACSMIGKPDLAVGQCAEVEFLYVNNPTEPCLYQPRLVRARPDKVASECEWAQLEGCVTSREVVAL